MEVSEAVDIVKPEKTMVGCFMDEQGQPGRPVTLYLVDGKWIGERDLRIQASRKIVNYNHALDRIRTRLEGMSHQDLKTIWDSLNWVDFHDNVARGVTVGMWAGILYAEVSKRGININLLDEATGRRPSDKD